MTTKTWQMLQCSCLLSYQPTLEFRANSLDTVVSITQVSGVSGMFDETPRILFQYWWHEMQSMRLRGKCNVK